jgi:hypothetical protein
MPPKKGGGKGGKTAEDDAYEEKLKLELELEIAARKEEREARLIELVKNLKSSKFEAESRLVSQFNNFLENKSKNEENRKKIENWERWMDQTGRPDMLSEKSMSAFVSRCVENPKNEKEKILEEYNLTNNIINDIKLLSLDYPEQIQDFQESIRKLNSMKQTRIDQMTQGYLIDPSGHIDAASGDFSHEFKDSNSGVEFMLWANSSKNPRKKNVEFDNSGKKVKVELPKGQCTDDAGLRVYFTKEDNFEVQMPKCLDPEPFSQPVEEIIEEEEEEVEEGSTTNLTGSGSASGEPAGQSSLPVPPQSEIGLGGSQKGEPEVLEAESILESVAAAEEEKNKKIRKELDGKSPIGGVWHIDFLRVPEGKKKISNWTIQRYSDPELNKVEAVVPQSKPKIDLEPEVEPNNEPEVDPTEADPSEVAADEPEIEPGFEISLPVPDESSNSEELSIGIWNSQENKWEMSRDIQISEQKDGSIYFKTKQTGAFRFFIDRHKNEDKPLIDTWLIRPNGEIIEFHLYLQNYQILFQILQNGNVNLVEQHNPKIMSEEYKNIELETLLEEMEKKALFIFPTDDSFQYLDYLEKDEFVISRTCQNLCSVSHNNNFKISEYNTTVDNSRIAISANENTLIATEDRFYIIEDQYLPPEAPLAPPVVEGESNTAFIEELEKFNEKIKKEEEDFEPDFDISRNGKTMEATLDSCLECESRINSQNLTIYKLLIKSKIFNF